MSFSCRKGAPRDVQTVALRVSLDEMSDVLESLAANAKRLEKIADDHRDAPGDQKRVNAANAARALYDRTLLKLDARYDHDAKCYRFRAEVQPKEREPEPKSTAPTIRQIRKAAGDNVEVYDDGDCYRATCADGFCFENGSLHELVAYFGDRDFRADARRDLFDRLTGPQAYRAEPCTDPKCDWCDREEGSR